MQKGTQTVAYDDALRLEAYRLTGIGQPFPNHFHEYTVIGLVEYGDRVLSCRGQTYPVHRGHVLLFNPGDNHACRQSDGGTLSYRGLNIADGVLLDCVGEITGKRELPRFGTNVVVDVEVARCLKSLHEQIMQGAGGGDKDGRKEESLLVLLSLLLQRYGQPFGDGAPACRDEIERVCAFLEQHYAERLSLDQMSRWAGVSKSTLLRAFVRAKGVTPYSYLENIRIGKAKQLLQQGVPPVEAALQTGFSDQSHFTNYFRRFIGLSPGLYRAIFVDKTTAVDSERDRHSDRGKSREGTTNASTDEQQ